MKTLKTELDQQGILSITLNRPEKLNALNADVFADLETVFHQAKNDKATKALLMTGEGKAFCAGADIHRLQSLSALEGYQFAREGQKIFSLLENLGKCSVAAINGYAFGGGCELALAATLRFCSEQAKFAQPEVKLGIIPGYGGTQRLIRLIGKARALQLCLSGEMIDAQKALTWGLVNEICPADQLLSRAKNYLQTLLQMAPLAVQSVLDIIHQSDNLSLAEGLELEALKFGLLCSTEDKQEGVQAFLNKTSAEFKGK